MGLKDRIKKLGQVRVDFWNEQGKPQTVTVELPEVHDTPVVAPEPAKPRIRKPKPVIAPEAKAPSPIPPAFQVPVVFEPTPAMVRLREVLDDAPPPVIVPVPPRPRITAPTARSFRTESTVCPACGNTVDAWKTYANGMVRCLPCDLHPKRGLHAV